MLQALSNKIVFTSFLTTMLFLTGCGGDYDGGTPAAGTYSPIGNSSVQEVLDCSGGVQSESIDIRANTFSPGSQTITASQIVKFENFDPVSHTVTSGNPNSPDNTFDITLAPVGSQNSERCLRFTAPGTFRYYDKLNTTVTGEIVVQ